MTDYFLNMFFGECLGGVLGVFGNMFGGVWGCFAHIYVMFCRDLGGQNGFNKLKNKLTNIII